MTSNRHGGTTANYSGFGTTSRRQNPPGNIIRCLKRHIAREIYHLLTNPHTTPDGTDLRSQRHHAQITLTHAAGELQTHPAILSAAQAHSPLV